MTVRSPLGATMREDRERAEVVRHLHADTMGQGAAVLLVHGSLALGSDEWEAQRPLAEEGVRLLVLDRRR